MHLRQLELGLGADTLGEGGVADHVAECLSAQQLVFAIVIEETRSQKRLRFKCSLTVPAPSAQTHCACCDPGSSGCW